MKELRSTDPAYLAILRTMGVLRRVMDPFFADFRISAAQWAILRILYDDEQAGHSIGLRLSDVSERLLIRPPSVTTVVDKLQRMGMVARTADAADQRAIRLSLTDEGRKLTHKIAEQHEQRVGQMMAGLKMDERTKLNDLLRQLTLHMETMSL